VAVEHIESDVDEGIELDGDWCDAGVNGFVETGMLLVLCQLHRVLLSKVCRGRTDLNVTSNV
jgi:hypothetical protein